MLELDLLHFHFYINTNFTEVNEITLTSGEYLRRIIECILSLSFEFFCGSFRAFLNVPFH